MVAGSSSGSGEARTAATARPAGKARTPDTARTGESAWLEVRGEALVDGSGSPVRLRGVGVGGWLNLENFITGHPSVECQLRSELERALGRDRCEAFFEAFLSAFFAEEDVAFVASLGLNVVRLPVNYHHLEDDDRPGEIKASGFVHLDRAVRDCAERGVYAMIDLHALPGGQNHDWHSDNPVHLPLFWRYREFQDRVVHLWEAIAEHYRDQPFVAGYNLINEPADPTGERLGPYYRRLARAVRAVDPRHVLFLDGDRYAQEFEHLGDPIEQAVYSLHHYPAPGGLSGGPYPGETLGQHYDAARVEEEFERRSEPVRRFGAPVLVGEFGPVYLGEEHADAMRRKLAEDQIGIYERHGASWCLWTYKDIGLQGVCHLSADSPWMGRLGPVIEHKARLGVDSWGGRASQLEDVLEPIRARFEREFPDFEPYPFGSRSYVHRLVRSILFSEPLVPQFAGLLAPLSDDELVALAESFRLEACVRRAPLCELLAEVTQASR